MTLLEITYEHGHAEDAWRAMQDALRKMRNIRVEHACTVRNFVPDLGREVCRLEVLFEYEPRRADV